MCSENVALGKVERISEGVVHMSLGGKMHDGIDTLFFHDVGDEVGTGDITLDKFEVFQAGDVFEVVKAGAVVEFVIDNNVAVGILFRKEDRYTRPDES